MPEQFYPAPVQGYSWAGQPPSSQNPFATAGTSMIQDYAIMRQRQEMEMYQRAMTPMPFRSVYQQSQQAFSPQGQFGMMNGVYQAQQDVTRQTMIGATAFAMTTGSFMATLPLFSVGEWGAERIFGSMAGRSALARGAFGVGRFAAGMGIGMALAYPVTAVAERGIERARWSADIERDIEAYSPRWTQGAGFGSGSTRQMAREMMMSMQDRKYDAQGRPEFFRPEDQLKIHKMGLASGILRGNSMEEYKRNFEDLKKNAKDIIQLLNTTIEGGMSVMKEMQGAGFRSPRMMAQQIGQARSLGVVSGVGTQNMLGIGMAGAANAVGTGWSGVAASNMYQTNAANMTLMAQNNPNVAQSVIGMGGLANATAQVSNSMMNMLRSGYGLRAMTAIMDPTNKIADPALLAKLGRGEMGPGEMISRSGRYGASGPMGGALNRVTAWRDIMRQYNNFTPEAQMDVQRGSYVAWAKGRGGVNENTAFAYASQFADTDAANVWAQMMVGPTFQMQRQGAADVQAFQMRYANEGYRNPFLRQVGMGLQTATNVVSAVADIGFMGARDVIESMRGARGLLYNVADVFIPGRTDAWRRSATDRVGQIALGVASFSREQAVSAASYRGGGRTGVAMTPNVSKEAALLAKGIIKTGAQGVLDELTGAAERYSTQGTRAGNLFSESGAALDAMESAGIGISFLRKSYLSENYNQIGNVATYINQQITANNKRLSDAEAAYKGSDPRTKSGVDAAVRSYRTLIDQGYTKDKAFESAMSYAAGAPRAMVEAISGYTVPLKTMTTDFSGLDYDKYSTSKKFVSDWKSKLKDKYDFVLNKAGAGDIAGMFGGILSKTEISNLTRDLGLLRTRDVEAKSYETALNYVKRQGIIGRVTEGYKGDAGAISNAVITLMGAQTYTDKGVSKAIGLLQQTTWWKDNALLGKHLSASDKFKLGQGALFGLQISAEDPLAILKDQYDKVSTRMATMVKEAKSTNFSPLDNPKTAAAYRRLLEERSGLETKGQEYISGGNSNGLVASSTPPNILNYWNSNWRVGQ